MAKRHTLSGLEERIRALEAGARQLQGERGFLRESEEKYRTILDSIEEGFFEVDLRGNLTFFNGALCKILGYPREELLGMNNRSYTTAETARRMYQIFNQIYRTGKPERITEYEVVQKGGKKRMLEVSASLMCDPAENPTGFYGLVRDVTERRRAVKALRESEEKYRILVENAGDAIFVIQNEKIKFPNPKAREIGLKIGIELERVPFIHYIHPEDKEMVLERHRKRLRGEHLPNTYTFRVMKKDGETMWAELNAVLIHWNGEPATLNFLRDVTPKKQLEARLQHAHKMEALGTLAGGIAHDFNNLLMGIQGRASLMLMDAAFSDSHYEDLLGIESIVKTGTELTKQLLGFARKGKYEVRPTDINRLIEKTSRMFGRTNKEIKIHSKYAPDLWTVAADGAQIEQVLLNLYVNAWQAMPGGGDLYLQTENVTFDEKRSGPYPVDPGRYVKISVTDTGMGMDKATQERIFEPFFTTKTMGRGTGLGLASAYGIIRNHGGMINVYSEKGHGATFRIYLPASDKKVVAERATSEPIPKGRETVLLVDDEEMILSIGEKTLKRMGYRVMSARSGKEAVELYRKHKNKIDIVVLDMVMPEIGGGETYDRLKAINPGVKVLLSSGYSVEGMASEILRRGCNGFIQKPFKMRELSRKIREIVRQR